VDTLAGAAVRGLRASGSPVVTDIGSVKASVVEAVTSRGAGPASSRFVGGHPMGGSERSGPSHASEAVLDGIVWVLTPTGDTDPGALEALQDWVRTIGARPVVMDPTRHDRLVAIVSHLP